MADFSGVAEEVTLTPPAARGSFEGVAEEVAVTPPQKGGTTIGRQAEGFVRGASSGLSSNLPLVGAAGGLMLGGPPGMILGGVGGLITDRIFRTVGDVKSPEQLPEDMRPAAFAGEVMGGSAPAALAPVAFAQSRFLKESGRIGQFFNKVLETAQRSPKAFAATEGLMAGGAATLSATAEATFPGQPEIRIPAEVVGGIFTPGSLLLKGADATVQLLGKARLAMSRDAQETRAGEIIKRVMDEFGENPEEVIKQLQGPVFLGTDPTSAQKAGSQALNAIEKELATESAQFKSESGKRAVGQLFAMRRAIELLKETGDPNLLREAAKLRSSYLESVLEVRFGIAQEKAIDAASKITSDTPEFRKALGVRIGEIVDDSLKKAREMERKEWIKVDSSIPAEPSTIIARALDIKHNQRLPEEGLPDLSDAFVKRMLKLSKEGKKSTVGELQLFRSRMLEKSREADKNNQANESRVFGDLAEAALDDLVKVEAVSDALDSARKFSLGLNNAFTRTFAGQTIATAQTGAKRIAPEVLVKRMSAGGPDTLSLRMDDLEGAVAFGDPESAKELLGLQERVLRLMASETLGPDGVLNVNKLKTFIKQNAGLIGKFKDLGPVLSSAQSAQETLQSVSAAGDVARRAIQKRAAFARVANVEDTVGEVGKILRGPNTNAEIAQLARLAKKEGPDAVDGLTTSLLESAWDRAGGNSGRFSFSAFQSAITQPVKAAGPSILSLMKRNGLYSADQQKALLGLVKQGAEFEEAVLSGRFPVNLTDTTSAFFDLALRLTGAQIGGASPVGQTIGSSLVMAQAGSRFVRSILDKVPQSKVKDIIIEAASKPDFMAALLAKPKGTKEKIVFGRQINAFLLRAGLFGPSEIIDDQEN